LTKFQNSFTDKPVVDHYISHHHNVLLNYTTLHWTALLDVFVIFGQIQ